MPVNAIKGVVENGTIRLCENVSLPERTEVYVIVAGSEPIASGHIHTPRLAHAEQARDFEKVVVERPTMPRYNAADYDPPAPVALVVLRDIATQKSLPDVPLLIDTGADVTLLPQIALERLGVAPLPGLEYELLGFDGTTNKARAVELEMIFFGKAFRGRYLLHIGERGILGRDGLSKLVLLLNGPRQEWSEHRGVGTG